MEMPKINVINLVSRVDKRDHIISEFKKHSIVNYEFWSGITCKPTFTAISKAHKNIVRNAKVNGLPYCVIAEDDCVFSDYGSLTFYFENMPDDFDLYLSSIYWGKIKKDNSVDDFSGFTLYTVHSRYYDEFLNTHEMQHIDRGQATRIENENADPTIIPRGKFIVCPLFVTYQKEIPSDNKSKDNEHGIRIINNKDYLHDRLFYCNSKPYLTWNQLHARSIQEQEESDYATLSVAENKALIAVSL